MAGGTIRADSITGSDGGTSQPSFPNGFGGKAFTQRAFTAGSGTWTRPTGCVLIRVQLVGGGGGGSGSGSTSPAGSDGGDTTFGPMTAGLGHGAPSAVSSGLGGAGGTASLGSGPNGFTCTGAPGGGGTLFGTGSGKGSGGMGGSSPFMGAGYSGINQAAQNAAANSGSGGAGAGGDNSQYAGAGGGSGGYVDATIASPDATYSYSVGAKGVKGGAGTSGFAGSDGGAGVIIVTEYYQQM